MATRIRVLLLAPALVLAAGPARADRHGMECFGGYSFANKNLKGVSLSCGIYADFFVTDLATAGTQQTTPPSPSPTPFPSPSAPPPPPPPGPPTPTPGGGAAPVAADDAEKGAAPRPDATPRPNFIVADVTKLTGEDDAGDDLTRYLVLGGFRRYFGVPKLGEPPKRWHPFGQILAGLTITERRRPTEYSPAVGVGAGLDVTLHESMALGGWWNVFLRVQCDVARVMDPGETVSRCGFGLSLRDEVY